jgi:3-oxoacyl-[acyl-carrier protein] reductase
VALNVTAVFRLPRRRPPGAAVQAHRQHRIDRRRAIIASPVYAASKGAVEGMTRSLAHELGRYGILTNCVAAGIFEGGLRSTIPEHHQKRYVDACALGRFGAPVECGELVAWLGSARNTYLNGMVLVLDGGTLA